MTNVPLFKVFMAPADSLDKELCNVLHSGMITQGKKVEEFETKLKEFFDYPYILSLNSATSGLTLALRLLDLNPGDEVLTTALTCTATNWPILSHNLAIKWVDTDPNTCNIDLTDLKEKITERTLVIMFVHWGGSPVDLDIIDELKTYTRNKYGFEIKVIEDCAHAFGSKYKDKFVGTHGNTCVFSLQAIKHLTTGDGGLIFLPNKEIYERAKLLRWFGIDREKRTSSGDLRMEPDVKEWGYKFHMNDINATIGLANLPFMNDNIAIARGNAEFYDRELSDLYNLKLLQNVGSSSYWLYTIRICEGLRDSFISYMRENNVVVSQVHQRNDIHTCVSEFKCDLSNLDQFQSEYVSIPVGWWVTHEDRHKICKLIKKFLYKDEISIRELIKDDYDLGFLELFKQLNGEINYSKSDFGFKLGNINHQDGYVCVALINGKIIGTAKVFIEDKFYNCVGHIEDVIVDSKYRDIGVCRLLINHLETYVMAVSTSYKIILECNENNVGLYEKLGYTKQTNSLVKRF